MFFVCSEAKRRLKAEQKEKEKAQKLAEAAAAAPKSESNKATTVAKINEEEISPNEYFKLRTAAVAELKKTPETDPYPHKFHVSVSLEQFIEKYSSLSDGKTLDAEHLR